MKFSIINKKQLSTKRKGKILSFLYILLLSIITFHHHPIDFAEDIQFFTQSSSETSSHLFTVEDCPIINFSNTGFNSFGISTFTLLIVKENCTNIIPNFTNLIPNNFSDKTYLRGPPSLKLI